MAIPAWFVTGASTGPDRRPPDPPPVENAPAPAPSNAPATTTTASRNPANQPAPATTSQPRSESTASTSMNGLRRSGQLALPPLARRLSVVAAERRGKGVRRGVAGPAGDLVEGQLARPQVIAGEGHPPVC